MVMWENYEEYLMLYTDGELNHEQETALMDFVAANPELKSELELYTKTRLTYERAEVYINKSSLLKPVIGNRVMAFPIWRRYAIAAGLAFLVVTLIFRYAKNQKEPIPLVQKQPVNQIPVNRHIPEIKHIDTVKQMVAQLKFDNNRPVKAIAPVYKTYSDAIQKKEANKIVDINSSGSNLVNGVDMEGLSLAKPILLSITRLSGDDLQFQEVPVYALLSSQPKTKSTLWDKLPMDDIKRKKLEEIAGGIAQAYNSLGASEQEASYKVRTIRIEKRRIRISL